MKIFRHITEQPFIFATGLAALIHSTWSLGTLFAGQAPNTLTWEYVGWLVPALLIAFAMDVGQISTSAQIRENGMTLARGTTFLVFALATYYLQWLYIAHHMPALDLAAGVSDIHRPLTVFLRDMGMWIIPALLPLSTLLYTFSGEHLQNAEPVKVQEVNPQPLVVVSDIEVNLLEAENPTFIAVCDCGWSRTYDNADSQQRGLNAHQQKCSYLLQSADSEVLHANS